MASAKDKKVKKPAAKKTKPLGKPIDVKGIAGGGQEDCPHAMHTAKF